MSITISSRICSAMVLLAAMSGVSFAVHAQESRHALIIGVSQYQDPKISPLTGVGADTEIAKSIAHSMGIPDTNIRLLRDRDATKDNVLNELQALTRRVPSGGKAFIYFSGHGSRWYDSAKGGCAEGLMTYDSRLVTNKEISDYTKKMVGIADKTFVMFDSCFSGGVNQAAIQSSVRSIGEIPQMQPKFLVAKDAKSEECMRATNLPSRGMGGDQFPLVSENLIHITSAQRDEVSFDEPGRGGLASQGVLHCIGDPATDSDQSGGMTLKEIETCTQKFIENKLKPFPNLIPHHIMVSGTRNIIPVQVPASQTQSVVSTGQEKQIQKVNKPLSVSQPIPEPTLASVNTLKDIVAQSSSVRQLEVKTDRSILRINKDPLNIKINSSHDGYVYLIMLGSDQKSFYVLFPNQLDANNKIKANTWISLPRPDWKLVAQGPEGVDNFLVVVSDSPRNLEKFDQAPRDAVSPFVYSLNNWSSRQGLINFFTSGSEDNQGSERFVAKLLTLREVK